MHRLLSSGEMSVLDVGRDGSLVALSHWTPYEAEANAVSCKQYD